MQERWHTDVFVLYMLEEFELTVGAFGEDGFAKGFRDPLDGDRCACELIFCGTEWGRGGTCALRKNDNVEGDAPYETRLAFRRAL